MSAGNPAAATLDRWLESPNALDPRVERLTDSIRSYAARQGLNGFTAEEIRANVWSNEVSSHVVAAAIGSLVSRGILVASSREASKHPEAKGRWVSRFVLAEGVDA